MLARLVKEILEDFEVIADYFEKIYVRGISPGGRRRAVNPRYHPKKEESINFFITIGMCIDSDNKLFQTQVVFRCVSAVEMGFQYKTSCKKFSFIKTSNTTRQQYKSNNTQLGLEIEIFVVSHTRRKTAEFHSYSKTLSDEASTFFLLGYSVLDIYPFRLL